jgi:hypothetical protein
MPKTKFKPVGVSFVSIEHIKKNYFAQLVPEPLNEHDQKAIAIYVSGIKSGYVPKRIAAKLNIADVCKPYWVTRVWRNKRKKPTGYQIGAEG